MQQQKHCLATESSNACLQEQCGDELYKKEGHRWFDRGHMVRRKDPIWGNSFEASNGNLDSMYFTNVCPQYMKVNEVLFQTLATLDL